MSRFRGDIFGACMHIPRVFFTVYYSNFTILRPFLDKACRYIIFAVHTT